MIQAAVTRASAAVLLAVALISGFTFAVIRSLPAHHDIAWPLYVGSQILNGARPYVDIIEVHPPLIVWFTLAAHLLAGASGMSAIAAYHVLTLAIALLSLALSARILAAVSFERPADRAFILLAQTIVLFPLVGYSFGQEEHLVLCLTFPYVFSLLEIEARPVSTPLRWMIGLLAGLGFAMKPLYGAVWIALEVYRASRRGWRSVVRPEFIGTLAVLVAYPLAVLVFAPGYLRVAGWAAQVYYDFHPTSFVSVLLSGSTFLVVLALLAQMVFDDHSRIRELRNMLVVYCLAATFVVFLQRKGWSYHWYPAIAVAAMLVLLISLRKTAAAVVVLACLALAGALELARDRAEYSTLSESPYYLPQMQRLVQEHAAGGSILALTTTIQIGFPLVNYTGVKWGSRFATMWPLPGLYAGTTPRPGRFPYHERSEMGELEHYFVDATYEDLRTFRPRLLIVDRYPPAQGLEGFGYVEYFGREARFMEIFRDYRFLANVGRFAVFKLGT